MNQYCRYCAHAHYADVVWCNVKEDTISESQAKRINKCKHFEFNELDVFNIEKKYQPRRTITKDENQIIFGGQENG